MEELNEKPQEITKVPVSKLTDLEQDIYNWTKTLPIDRVCAMYELHAEDIQAIIKKVK